jgi:uncharacterized protein (DUF2461 family)
MSGALDLLCFRDPARAFFDATFCSHVSDVNKMEKENGNNRRSQYHTEKDRRYNHDLLPCNSYSKRESAILSEQRASLTGLRIANSEEVFAGG